MTEENIHESQEQPRGGEPLVLHGEKCMEGAAMRELEKSYLDKLEKSPATEVLMDLTGVDYMDSRGLSVAIALFRACQKSGRTFAVKANAEVYRLLTVMNLDKVMTLRKA